ncbi:hypothetical protein [Escherichia phage phAPEC8_ev052]|nr:hypothetical protein [Escherichia phage phAPEC8_ev052]
MKDVIQMVFRVTLDGIHVVKGTQNYTEAKEHFLEWIDTLKTQDVSYNRVTLTGDHTPIMEYVKK